MYMLLLMNDLKMLPMTFNHVPSGDTLCRDAISSFIFFFSAIVYIEAQTGIFIDRKYRTWDGVENCKVKKVFLLNQFPK